MKSLVALTFAVAAVVAAPTAWAGQIVQMTASGFVPNNVTIPTEDSIMWTNKDAVARQVIADAGAFKSPLLQPGESYTYEFPVAGTYTYRGVIKPDQRGTVTVRRVEARAVTIGVSKRVVTAGHTVELAGSISSGEGGKAVRILISPYRGIQTAKTVITEPDGTWSLHVKPAIRTEYLVEFGSLVSRSAPVVHVRPKLTLLRRNGRFVAAAHPSKAFGRKLIHLQRRIGNRWRTIDVVRTARNGVVRFDTAVPQGRQVLRLMVRAAPGYLAGYSNRLAYRS